ncbi:hypothetical protein Pcinc_018347 [Petrolisthes cinctipes]|uniref:Uncharacterized protein n=1 Tax=Petrolisthes cinctipes TaxID=88211 RepID=A0AAE1FNS7_PETCI|nr:hypothetical protein Pcinc_018347 [Petrolisthes cinctipes]
MARLRHVLLVVVMGSLVHAQGDETALECPYPEGQSVNSEGECARYSACQWNNGVCHMNSNSIAGYRTTAAPTLTPAGFQVMLEKLDREVTLFDGDIQQLMFEVINHEEYHIQIKVRYS